MGGGRRIPASVPWLSALEVMYGQLLEAVTLGITFAHIRKLPEQG